MFFVLDIRLPSHLRQQLGGKRWIIYYIDDFIIGAPTQEALLKHTIETFTDLGLEIKWSKLQPPSQNVRILGFVYDTRQLTVSLPDEKVLDILELIDIFTK